MSGDFLAKSLSNAQVRALAKKLREFFGISAAGYVDVLKCLKQKTIWTVNGIRRLHFEIRSDVELGDDDAVTVSTADTVYILVKESVERRAFFGEGRPRNTLAHELGHGALGHDRAPMSRSLSSSVTPTWMRGFESAEHQVKVFAPAFLINDAIADTLTSAEAISVAFGISLESAKIYFSELVQSRDRTDNAQRVLEKAREFREFVRPQLKQAIQFLDEPCTVCGNKTIFPVGVKFMCQTCDNVSDRFQDGDTLR